MSRISIILLSLGLAVAGDAARVVFSTFLGGPGEDAANAVAVDGQGNLYVAWQSSGGSGDAVVSKFSPNGTTLFYSTVLGGSDSDIPNAIAVDSTGAAYVAGLTYSSDFPLAAPYRNYNSGRGDAFVAKVSPSGTLVYSTYLGGMGYDVATGIAVDSAGAAYVTGQTYSATFPMQLSYQSSLRGPADAFVTKLGPSGQGLAFSTFLGGNGVDGANAIALDASGQAHVTGMTDSVDFPLRSPLQAIPGGATDAFVAKLSQQGNTLEYSTYLGGSGDEAGNAVAVDAEGACVTGLTASTNFPTVRPFQARLQGGADAFLTHIAPSGSQGQISTYLGGSAKDEGTAIARGTGGLYYVAGLTYSGDFPTSSPLQASLAGESDVFITQLAGGGESLAFSTYLGGRKAEAALGLALGSSGRILVSGVTGSADFPTVSARQPAYGGGVSDGFLLRIDPSESVYTTSLHFPRLVTVAGSGPESSEYTGIAVANLGSIDAVLRFSALDETGRLIGGPGISNPALVQLAAKNQMAALDTQIFGAGLPAKKPVGWVRLESTIAETAGFFLAFNGKLDVQDGADVRQATLVEFLLPEIEDSPGSTQLFIANPGANPTTVGLELVRPDGQTSATATNTIAAGGVLVGGVEELFPGTSPDGGYYVRGTASSGVTPFEYLAKSGRYIQGINGLDAAQGTSRIYAPQYVIGGPWRTALGIVNLDRLQGRVQARFVSDEGIILGSRTFDLAARAKMRITAQDFFVTPPTSGILQGYVEITGSPIRICGSVVFGDPDRNRFSTALPLVSRGLQKAVFSQVASDSTYFTGMAAVNPGETEESALVEVYDRKGQLIRSKTIRIGAKRRASQLLTEYFPDLPAISSGYFRLTSHNELMSFALFGTNALTALSAVPPQAVP